MPKSPFEHLGAWESEAVERITSLQLAMRDVGRAIGRGRRWLHEDDVKKLSHRTPYALRRTSRGSLLSPKRLWTSRVTVMLWDREKGWQVIDDRLPRLPKTGQLRIWK